MRYRIETRHVRDRINDSWTGKSSLTLAPANTPPSPVFTLHPWLMGVEPSTMEVLWETNTDGYPVQIEWGRANTDEGITRSFVCTYLVDGHCVYRARLEPLQPETRDVYRVRVGDVVTPVYSFRTAPNPESPFTIAWMSDPQDFPDTFRTVLPNIRRHTPDLVAFA